MSDPPPRQVRIAYRRKVIATASSNPMSPVASVSSQATLSTGGVQATASASSAYPNGSQTQGPLEVTEEIVKETLDVTGGVAEKVFDLNQTFTGTVNNPQTGIMSTVTSGSYFVNFAVAGYDVPRDDGQAPGPARIVPPPVRQMLSGEHSEQPSDPTFTRWLALSFSPTLRSQPFRTQSGPLPTPWGNMQCFYAIALHQEPNPPNFDLFGAGLFFLPAGPVSAVKVTLESTVGYTPARYFLDANGDRVVIGRPDVHSEFVEWMGGGFELRHAGPPGAIRQRGPYTYTFEPLSGTPGRARLLTLADDLGKQQTLGWGGSSLTVTDLTSGRQLLFSSVSSPYFNRVNAPSVGGFVGTRTELTLDGGGHLTMLKVFPDGSQTPTHTDQWSYSGDAIVTSSRGAVKAYFSYVSSLFPDPWGNSLLRLSSASYGDPFDTSSSDNGGSIQGTYSFTYGPKDNRWGKSVRKHTLTDARGAVSSLLYGMNDDLSDNTLLGEMKWFQLSGPDYVGAPQNSNTRLLRYSPNVAVPNTATLTDPLGSLWTALLDSERRVISASNPQGQTSQITYNGPHVASVTDPTGVMWAFGYGGGTNGNARLTSVTDPGGTVVTNLAYNPFGQPTSITVPAAVSASGQTETAQAVYDAVTGDLTRLTDPLGRSATINAYGALGDPLSFSVFPDTGDPATSLTPLTATIDWDAAQRFLSGWMPNGAQIVPTRTNGVTTKVEVKSPFGAVLSQVNLSTDSRGRVYQTSDLVGLAAQYRYDKNSNLTKVIDPRGYTTQLIYGPNDEPTGVVWPGGQTAGALYNAGGQVRSTTDERGIVTNYFYDNAGRLTDVQFPAYPTQNVHLTYDAAGRLLSVTDASGSTTYNYEPIRKRLTSVVSVVGTRTYTVSYTYYGDGKVASMTSPAGMTTYQYDMAGQWLSSTDPRGQTTTWTYDKIGRVTSQATTTAQGAVISSQYTWGVSGQGGDPSTAPAYLRQIIQRVNGQTGRQYTLTHSYLGQRLARTGTGTGNYQESAQFGYDGRGRLTAEQRLVTSQSRHVNFTGAYQYDLADNLQGGLNGWTYNSNNQVTNAPAMGGLSGATGLSYDAAGNLTTYNGYSLTYDPWGNLASITGNGKNITFTYNAFGQRVSRTENGHTTHYVYDGDAPVAEMDAATGQKEHTFWWGEFGLILDTFFDPSGNASSRVPLYDDEGDTRLLLDEVGTMLGAWVAGAFDQLLASSPVPDPPLNRSGDRYEGTTSLIYRGSSAFYTPVLGRYTQPSAPGYLDGNPYGYEPEEDDFWDALSRSGNWGGLWGKAFDQGRDDLLSMSQFQPGSRERQQISGMLNSLPVIGEMKAGYELYTGRDDVAGVCLSQEEKILTLATLTLGALRTRNNPHQLSMAQALGLPPIVRRRGGRLGNPAHSNLAEEIAEALAMNGYTGVKQEFYVKMSWRRRGRFADVAGFNPTTQQWELFQVGKVNRYGNPIPREVSAINDFIRAGYPNVNFVPYNR